MAVRHDQAADRGIGRGKPPPACRKGDGGGHVTPVLRGIGGGQYGFRSDGFGSGAQGWAAPLWVGAGADFSVASALARRRSSCALICFSASLRRAVLRASSFFQSMPKISATPCISLCRFWIAASRLARQIRSEAHTSELQSL